MSATVEIQLVIAATGMACSILGTFLLLRRMTMLTDAITHAVLPGIVIGFLLTHDLASPWLIVGATAAGLLTVWLVELLFSSGNLKQDAAIGLVFPALFAVGVLLITMYASDVHLDIDAVLTGEPALLPFDRLAIAGLDLGPRALWPVLGSLLVNAALVLLCAHPLRLTTFDPQLAAVMGLAPGVLTYLLMGATAVTAVAAFDAVGSVLVVALFTAPAATAWLLSDRLVVVQVLATGIAVLASVLGVQTAIWFDVSIAGMVAAACGVLFGVAVLLAPQRGAIPRALRFRRARLQAGV
ncbi:MAG: metal ABC transporter permease, partial [Candidatus Dadabacteria bacterium]